MTYPIPHPTDHRQLSVNNVWSSIMGSQGIAQIFELITVLLPALLGKNLTYNWNNTDFKIIDIAHCQTCKK
jgi:hypothetical protein